MRDDPFVARVLRRMAWRHTLPWLARGLAAGLLAAGALLLLSRLIAWDGAAWWALGAGIAGALAGAMVAWLTRPRAAAALRAADRLLGLRDRLCTAWEYAGREAPMLRLQRADLTAQTARIDLRRGLRIVPRRRDATAPALGAVLLLAAIVLPYPSNHAAADRAATHAHIAHAASRIAAATHAAGSLPRSTLSALPKADRLRQLQIARILARLQRQLAAAHARPQALTSIARAQSALNKLAVPHAAALRAALAALANALAHSAATHQLANAVKQGNPAALAKAAKQLAGKLAHMSPKERADLARTMQAAANASASDAALSQALQNAATALAQGDSAGARSALAQAGQQAAADQARSAQQSALDQANSTLDNARNDVSGLSQGAPSGQSSQGSGQSQSASGQGKGQSNGQGKGAGQGQSGKGQGAGQGGKGHGGSQGAGQGRGSGKGQGAGQGQGNGQGQGSGQGQGQGNGQGNGSGSGQGQGQGNGSGSGQGGSGGQGLGGGRGGSGSANGNANGDRVYVPGQQGQGPTTTAQGQQAQPTSGSTQPWRSVLPAYERSARAALENSALPPDQQTLVKRYFDALNQ